MSAENFLDDADPSSVMHDGFPDLNKYLFIHSSLDDAGLDPFEFRIFCHLRRRAKDRKAWPGMRSIAEVTGISLNKVCTTIRSLQNKGFLEVRKRPGNHQSNIYLVRSPAEKNSVPVENAEKNSVPDKNTSVPDKNERYSIEGTPISLYFSNKERDDFDFFPDGKIGKTEKATPKDEAEVIRFCTSLGLTEVDADWAWNKWKGTGFKVGTKAIKDWKCVIRAWKAQGYFPSQKQTSFADIQIARRDATFARMRREEERRENGEDR